MSERYDNYGERSQRRLWPIVSIAVLIIVVLVFALVSGGGDDPDPIADVLPTSEMVERAKEESGYSSQQYLPEGVATAPGRGEAGREDADPSAGQPGHSDEPSWQEVGGRAAGDAVATAEAFADLQINRPVDPEGSAETDAYLAELAVGILSHQISKSDMMAAQIASTGEVIRSLILEETPELVTVLITTREELPEGPGAIGGTRYLNYIAHLRRISDGRFGVISWEPQL